MSAFLPSQSVPIPKIRPTSCIQRKRIRPVSCQLPQIPRRAAIQVLSLLTLSPFLPARAATSTVTLGEKESSDLYGYSFRAPSGWTKNTASLSSFRTATVYLCDEDDDSNISMVVTPVPSDYQKLTSFGSIDNILQTIVPSNSKDVSGEVITTRTDPRNNAYVIEYAITAKGVTRHLLTTFSLQPGRYLITLTGQTKNDNWGKQEPVIRAVADSYQLQIFD